MQLETNALTTTCPPPQKKTKTQNQHKPTATSVTKTHKKRGIEKVYLLRNGVDLGLAAAGCKPHL